MSTYLTEIARQKKQQWLNYQKEHGSDRENWTQQVKGLYSQIKLWLKPLEQEGLLRYQEETLPEPPIYFGNGRPEQFELTIEFFNGAVIKFKSVGLDIVGAYGRIDLQLGLRKLMLIQLEKEGEWLFTERYSLEKTPTYAFNQAAFEEIVTDFIESF
jgi:hypothetical protein